MRIVTFIFVCMAWLVLGVGVFAQERIRVEVSITSSSGGSHYVDRGRIDGLEIGDSVTFFPSTALAAEGTVRAVSKNSARVELAPGSAAVGIGDRGEILIPKVRVQPKPIAPPIPAPETERNVVVPAPVPTTPPTLVAPTVTPLVEHPAWTHPPEEWQLDKPLLAPAFGLRPEERERRVRGRAWLQSQYTRDSEGGSRTYSNSSVGVDATMENPFGRGGELRIGAAGWSRSFDVESENDQDTQSRFRLNRLSYTVGGTEDHPTRWNLGRFLQSGLPEFGLLDGAEWNRRLSNGDEFGVSIGAMPVPTSSLSTFDDVQAAAFYRRALDDEHKSSVGLGYQNTWHDGEQDRNLLLAEARFEPGRSVSIRSTAWLDMYGSEDEIKGSGFELTEFLVALSWRVSTASGLGLTLSHRKIPELLRSELQDFDPATIRDSKLERIALNGWTSVSAQVRLDGRVDRWSDESDDGTAGELGAALRDFVWDRGELRASVFYSSGTYSSGPGGRLTASKSFERASASFGYEYVDYEQKGFAGDQRQLAQQSLFGTVDFPVSERWDLSLLGDRRFGDNQDSWSLGFMLQTRF
ncbi:MAG: hypothetical protein SGI72_12030 [Planctomycetota bacterium]|nr:hypothetical protein [Planctomycetota bacterium]